MEEKESIGKVKRQRTFFEFPEGTRATYVDRYIEIALSQVHSSTSNEPLLVYTV